MIRLPETFYRRSTVPPEKRRRRYESGDVGSEAGTLVVFVALFGLVGVVGGYILGVPAVRHGVPNLDFAQLQLVLSMLREIFR